MKKFLLYGLLILPIMVNGTLMQAQNDSYLRGMALMQQAQYDEAIGHFDQAITDLGVDVNALLHKGEALMHLGSYDEAKSLFLQIQDKAPAISSIWLARCHAMMGETGEAIRHLRNHLGSDDRFPEKTIMADPFFQRIERSRDWRRLWSEDWYTPSDYQRAEAEYLISNARYADALSILDILIAKEDDDAVLYCLRGRAHAGRNDLKNGFADLDRAISLDRQVPEFYEVRAGMYLRTGRTEEAILDLSQAWTLAPEKFYLLLDRARAYEKAKAPDRALEDVAHYLDYFQEDVEAMLYASELHLKNGRYFEALNDLNRALDINPGEEELYLKRGALYLATETFEYAERDFTMALDLDPFNGNTYFQRGLTRLNLQDPNGACYDFKKAFQMGEKQALGYLQDHCNY